MIHVAFVNRAPDHNLDAPERVDVLPDGQIERIYLDHDQVIVERQDPRSTQSVWAYPVGEAAYLLRSYATEIRWSTRPD